MNYLAHVQGVPLEELLLLPLAYGSGAVVWLAAVRARTRRGVSAAPIAPSRAGKNTPSTSAATIGSDHAR